MMEAYRSELQFMDNFSHDIISSPYHVKTCLLEESRAHHLNGAFTSQSGYSAVSVRDEARAPSMKINLKLRYSFVLI